MVLARLRNGIPITHAQNGASGESQNHVSEDMESLAPPSKRQKLESSHPEASVEECDESGRHEEPGECQITNNPGHVMEKDVGITEYISPQLPGFFAILKQR